MSLHFADQFKDIAASPPAVFHDFYAVVQPPEVVRGQASVIAKTLNVRSGPSFNHPLLTHRLIEVRFWLSMDSHPIPPDGSMSGLHLESLGG